LRVFFVQLRIAEKIHARRFQQARDAHGLLSVRSYSTTVKEQAAPAINQKTQGISTGNCK